MGAMRGLPDERVDLPRQWRDGAGSVSVRQRWRPFLGVNLTPSSRTDPGATIQPPVPRTSMPGGRLPVLLPIGSPPFWRKMWW